MTEPRRWVVELGRMPTFTANGRYHWTSRSTLTRQWREIACYETKLAKVPPLSHARIWLVYWPPDRRRRDPSNLMPAQKACVDGVVDAGIVKDDSPEFVEELMPLIMPAKDAKAAGKQGVYELWIEDADGVKRLCDVCGDQIASDSESGLCRVCSQTKYRPVWPGEWRLQAACIKGMWSVDMWFQAVGRSEPHHCGRPGCTSCYCAARFVCAGCPVLDECLEHALKHSEPAGMWGALTTDERQRLVRNRRRHAARKAS